MKHWKLLQQYVFAEKNKDILDHYSVKRINSFDLIPSTIISDSITAFLTPLVSIQIHQDVTTTLQSSNREQEVVDNTGNVGLWLSEEVLTFLLCDKSSFVSSLLLQQLHHKEYKPWKGIELGCGQSALASIALHHICQHFAPQVKAQIYATDGNAVAVSKAQQNIVRNCKCCSGTISSLMLLWQDRPPEWKHCMDFIFAADCLFFTAYHDDLLELFHHLLVTDKHGIIVLVAPKRGTTLQQFVEKLKQQSHFSYTLREEYHPKVTAKHEELLRTKPEYDPSIHYPLCITIRRNIKI